MASLKTTEELISQEFSSALKEYAAFDRTLDALAALSFILQNVDEISKETLVIDFAPRIESADPVPKVLTPDGLFIQKPHFDFILELKTSWNDNDVNQIVKYARSPVYFLKDGTGRPFNQHKCCLLGYQNPPGESNLDKLLDAWTSEKIESPLVIFRYSLDQGAEGDRLYFARVAYGRNGLCPSTHFGKALNSPRGFPVSADNFKKQRSRFHKANDQAIPSYAAVMWWTKYAVHYLSEDQKSEMAERGRLTEPLVIPLDKVSEVPKLADVDVPLGPSDVRHALEFLEQAKLVALKKKKGTFEVQLRGDRYIRLPQGSPVPTSGQELSTKILARWATHKIKKPVSSTRKGTRKQRGQRDRYTRSLFED
jgi:hypothetical protein